MLADDGSVRALVLLGCEAKMTSEVFTVFVWHYFRHRDDESIAEELRISPRMVPRLVAHADKLYDDLQYELALENFDIFAAKRNEQAALFARAAVFAILKKRLDGITYGIFMARRFGKLERREVESEFQVARATVSRQEHKGMEVFLRVLREMLAERNLEPMTATAPRGEDSMTRLADSYYESIAPMEQRVKELKRNAAIARDKGDNENAFKFHLRVTSLQKMINEMRRTAFECDNYYKERANG